MIHKGPKEKKCSFLENLGHIPNSFVFGDFESYEEALMKIRELEDEEEKERLLRSLTQSQNDVARRKRRARMY